MASQYVAPPAMPICQCGKEVQDWRGARGHVQYTDDPDGPHGPEGDVPDGYRDLFESDEQDEQDEPDKPEADQDDGGDQDRSGGDWGSRLRKAFTDDVRHLWGGA